MTRGRPNGFGARRLGVLGLWAALALAAPAPAAGQVPDTPVTPVAEPPAGASGRAWISVGLITGSTQFDAELADYQWDTTPRPGWGVQALAGRGRLALGLRAWRASSTQSIGDLGAAPKVHATSLELVGEGRLAEVLGTQVLATIAGGRLHLGYDPDRVTIQPPAPAGAIEVDLAPVGAWIGGGGLALRHAVAPAWSVGLGVDARVFAIETAHRSGDAIVLARESFGDWSARFELAWLVKGGTR